MSQSRVPVARVVPVELFRIVGYCVQYRKKHRL